MNSGVQLVMMYRIVYTKLSHSLLSQCDTRYTHAQMRPRAETRGRGNYTH